MHKKNHLHAPFLSATLKSLRLIYGLSQSYIAKRLQVKQSTVSDLENGNIHVGEDTLQVMSEIFEIRKEEILLLAQNEPKENIRLAIDILNSRNYDFSKGSEMEHFLRLYRMRYIEENR